MAESNPTQYQVKIVDRDIRDVVEEISTAIVARFVASSAGKVRDLADFPRV